MRRGFGKIKREYRRVWRQMTRRIKQVPRSGRSSSSFSSPSPLALLPPSNISSFGKRGTLHTALERSGGGLDGLADDSLGVFGLVIEGLSRGAVFLMWI